MKSEILSVIYDNLGKVYGEYYTSKAIRNVVIFWNFGLWMMVQKNW